MSEKAASSWIVRRSAFLSSLMSNFSILTPGTFAARALLVSAIFAGSITYSCSPAAGSSPAGAPGPIEFMRAVISVIAFSSRTNVRAMRPEPSFSIVAFPSVWRQPPHARKAQSATAVVATRRRRDRAIGGALRRREAEGYPPVRGRPRRPLGALRHPAEEVDEGGAEGGARGGAGRGRG